MHISKYSPLRDGAYHRWYVHNHVSYQLQSVYGIVQAHTVHSEDLRPVCECLE